MTADKQEEKRTFFTNAKRTQCFQCPSTSAADYTGCIECAACFKYVCDSHRVFSMPDGTRRTWENPPPYERSDYDCLYTGVFFKEQVKVLCTKCLDAKVMPCPPDKHLRVIEGRPGGAGTGDVVTLDEIAFMKDDSIFHGCLRKSARQEEIPRPDYTSEERVLAALREEEAFESARPSAEEMARAIVPQECTRRFEQLLGMDREEFSALYQQMTGRLFTRYAGDGTRAFAAALVAARENKTRCSQTDAEDVSAEEIQSENPIQFFVCRPHPRYTSYTITKEPAYEDLD